MVLASIAGALRLVSVAEICPIRGLDDSGRTDAPAQTAMMAPLPTSSHTDDRPELPRVRLDVRAASGRSGEL